MKTINLCILTALAVVPSALSAFAIRASQLVHPENSQGTVTIISDEHINADPHSPIRNIDEGQVRELTEHLSSKPGCIAIIEDQCKSIEERENYKTRFLPGTASILQKNGINAYAVDFRKDCIDYQTPTEYIDSQKILNEAKILMNTYQCIEGHVPVQYQEDLKELKKEIGTLISTSTSIFSEGTIDAQERWQNINFNLRSQLFDFVLLAEINKHIAKHDTIYICTGYAHAKVIEQILKKAGFSCNAKTLSSSPDTMSLRDIQSKTYGKHLDYITMSHPINLKKALENIENGISAYTPYPTDGASAV